MKIFKIDEAVTLPISSTPEIVRRTRGPNKPKIKRCDNKDHMPEIGKCEKCGDVFPCVDLCEHLDCLDYKDLPWPEWLSEWITPHIPEETKISLDTEVNQI